MTGRAKYTYDINRPGMIYGKIVRSPHPHARVVSVDLSEAQKAPGVKAVLAWKEPGAQVMYQGDPVAAVAADTEERAIDAARLVRVRYEALPHLANVEQAMAPMRRRRVPGGNTKQGAAEENGNLDDGFKQAAHIVEATYATHVITHVCLETHGSVCEWDGDKLTAWVSTQAVHGTKDGFAQGLKIPAANVRVITQYMGGGFGSKFGPDAQGLICAKLAQQAKVPVKLMLDRKEEHLDTGNRPSATAHIRAGRVGRRQADGVRRPELGHRRRGRGVGLPAAVHLQLPEPQAHAQGRLHQRRPAARDARAGTSAGMLPHGNPDGRARGSREDGSGRVPHQEPAAGGAQRDVGRVLRARREGVRLGQAASDRRRDAGSDQDRLRHVRASVGRRRPRLAGALRHRQRRQRRHEVRHAGSRHRHADDRRDASPPKRSACRSAP